MKFMFSLHEPQLSELIALAEKKNCTIQELIRVVIIPEWKELKMNGHNLVEREKRE